MRFRVLGVLGILSILIVLGTCYALLAAASRGLTQELQINRVTALNRLAQVAADGESANDSSTVQTEMDTYSNLYGEGVLVRMPGQTLSSGGLDGNRRDVENALVSASLNLSATTLTPLQPLGGGNELMSRSFGSANQVLGEVVLDVNTQTATDKLRAQWLVVVSAALALEATLLLLAARVTGWVLRPVHRLNSAAVELARTGSQVPLPEDGPPELRELSHSFTTMARTVTENLDQQRLLIAETSHQLRNPVAALRLRMDLLQLRLRSVPEQESATAALAELERVERILDGMLRLAAAEHRAAANQVRSATGPAADGDLRAALRHVALAEIDRALPAARAAGTTVSLEAASGPEPDARCDPFDLSQMIGELLANAVKYAPGANAIVTIRAPGNTAEIEVADDGPGLGAAELAESTTRFWRSPGQSGVPGSGLGLAIVDQLARANGGSLRLAVRRPHGLCATLTFRGATGEAMDA